MYALRNLIGTVLKDMTKEELEQFARFLWLDCDDDERKEAYLCELNNVVESRPISVSPPETVVTSYKDAPSFAAASAAKQFWLNGDRVNAIKTIRRATEWTLVDSRNYCLGFDDKVTSEEHPSDDAIADARELLSKGRKVAAVRCIRVDTGWGLRQALKYVNDVISIGIVSSH